MADPIAKLDQEGPFVGTNSDLSRFHCRYLLRTSTNLKGGVVVSFHCSGATRHFQFKRDGDCFVNKDGKKVGRTVVELIR